MLKSLSLVPVRALALRTIHTTSSRSIREIVVKEEGNTKVIEGRILPSPREKHLLKLDQNIVQNACILCRLNLDIKHTDVLILQQFVSSKGVMLPRKVTGLCKKQYKRINKLVAMAQEAGLMGDFTTWEGDVILSERTGFKKYNTYYDESTLDVKPKNRWMLKQKRDGYS